MDLCNHISTRRLRRSGFTLVELLVAVVVLLVVIIAVARIFSTVGQVTAYGKATAELLQEARAIEDRMRQDLARLSAEGFFAIQCVEVRNDANFAQTGQLLDPTKDVKYVFRADRLIFFMDGHVPTSGYVDSQEISPGSVAGNNPNSMHSRVYYGHAVQFPTAAPLSDPCCYGDGQPLAPWSASDPFDENTLVEMQAWPNGGFGQPIVGTQPQPSQWLLMRQPVLLADDGGSPLFYASQDRNAAGSIWPDYDGGTQDRGSIRKGRVDIASQTSEQIQRYVTRIGDSFPANPPANYDPVRPFFQSSGGTKSSLRIIADAFSYPRGEKTPPSSRREDQLLTSAMLGSNVSSFAIDWTYDDGVGRQLADDGTVLGGVDFVTGNLAAMTGAVVDVARPIPWFGLPGLTAAQNPYAARGVQSFTNYSNSYPTLPIYPIDIEGQNPVDVSPLGNGSNAVIRTYQAAFGVNRGRAYETLGPGPEGRWMDPELGYAPLPTAIRVTLKLHDSRGTIQEGQTFQFVISIPRRN